MGTLYKKRMAGLTSCRSLGNYVSCQQYNAEYKCSGSDSASTWGVWPHYPKQSPYAEFSCTKQAATIIEATGCGAPFTVSRCNSSEDWAGEIRSCGPNAGEHSAPVINLYTHEKFQPCSESAYRICSINAAWFDGIWSPSEALSGRHFCAKIYY
jgi:hypothetical protein